MTEDRGRPSTRATAARRSASSGARRRRMLLVLAMISRYHRRPPWSAALAQALPPGGPLPVALDAQLLHDAGAGGVDDVLGLVQQLGRPLVQAGWFLGRGRADQVAVGPVDVGQAGGEAHAVRRAPPGGLRSEVDVALPHRLAGRVGPALVVLAVGPHRHGTHLLSYSINSVDAALRG